jgi:SAM-dependent methyltransferase
MADLGCGNGRWSFYLTDIAQSLILIDFSDAVFVARNNLRHAPRCLYFMGDLQQLPFADNFADFLFCLGVLHHLPVDALAQLRRLKRYAKKLLIFLYYALDNRPWYFRLLLSMVTMVRMQCANIRQPWMRHIITQAGIYCVYLPLIYAGKALKPFGMSSKIPLYDFYHDKSIPRIKQDVYDRFFTRIEQRFTRKQILSLRDTFSNVIVSDDLPYWHFLCF